uniref:Uncharacterized protein n=1 Tax=Arundo donax TaxID=35708 RepID=A0A0A9AW36_ARUDO
MEVGRHQSVSGQPATFQGLGF